LFWQLHDARELGAFLLLIHLPTPVSTPYGGKSIGEQPIATVAPAVVNAVLDAVGVSITELPVTSEKVYRALLSART
jgi:CO/xanthine dehydrogenase Mo-binding subunit